MARFYDPNAAYTGTPYDVPQDVASYFRPRSRFATSPNPGEGMESSPDQDFGGYTPPPEHLPNIVGGAPAPVLHRDSNANRTAGLLAALLPILGGRADLAGQFGSAAIQGRRQGEDERYQRDVQNWQNQERQDAEGRAEGWRQFGADSESAQGRNQLKRWEAADTRQAEESRIAEEDRQRQRELQASAAQEKARLAQRGDVEFGVSQHEMLMKQLKTLAPEARGAFLDSLAQSGQLKARGLDTTFTKSADGQWNLPQFDAQPDTKMLGHELAPWHDVLINPNSTQAARAFALSQQAAILQKYGSRGQSPATVATPAPQAPVAAPPSPQSAQPVPSVEVPNLVPAQVQELQDTSQQFRDAVPPAPSRPVASIAPGGVGPVVIGGMAPDQLFNEMTPAQKAANAEKTAARTSADNRFKEGQKKLDKRQTLTFAQQEKLKRLDIEAANNRAQAGRVFQAQRDAAKVKGGAVADDKTVTQWGQLLAKETAARKLMTTNDSEGKAALDDYGKMRKAFFAIHPQLEEVLTGKKPAAPATPPSPPPSVKVQANPPQRFNEKPATAQSKPVSGGNPKYKGMSDDQIKKAIAKKLLGGG